MSSGGWTNAACFFRRLLKISPCASVDEPLRLLAESLPSPILNHGQIVRLFRMGFNTSSLGDEVRAFSAPFIFPENFGGTMGFILGQVVRAPKSGTNHGLTSLFGWSMVGSIGFLTNQHLRIRRKTEYPEQNLASVELYEPCKSQVG